MPLVRLQTSATLDDEQRRALAQRLSSATAWLLGKPESYLMVVIEPPATMLMGGEDAPAAYLDVRAVGTISAEQAGALSREYAKILVTALNIDPERIFTTYTGVPASHWAHGDKTFG
ncbi:MAG: phenylpyruvate tautomerase MIF-related protein [Myxococcota bacterium]